MPTPVINRFYNSTGMETDRLEQHVFQLKDEFSAAGFGNFHSIAIEGFGWLVPDFTKTWNDESRRNKLLQYIRQTENDPVMTGISAHVMTIAKKE